MDLQVYALQLQIIVKGEPWTINPLCILRSTSFFGHAFSWKYNEGYTFQIGTEVRSEWNRCGIKVRSKWDRCEIEIKPMWDRRETDVRPSETPSPVLRYSPSGKRGRGQIIWQSLGLWRQGPKLCKNKYAKEYMSTNKSPCRESGTPPWYGGGGTGVDAVHPSLP